MITLDMKKNRIRIHKRTLHLMNDPKYVYICVNPNKKTIAICACDDNSKDAIAVRTKRDCEIYSSGLFYELARINRTIDDDSSYRVTGNIKQGDKIAEFSIFDAVVMGKYTEKEK